MDLGTHLVDLALDLFGGPPATVSSDLYAKGARLAAPALEDHASATLRFPDGGTARIACSWNLHAGRDAVIAVDLHGTEGGLSLRNVGGSFTDFEAHLHQRTDTTLIAAPPDDWGGRTAVAWARALAAGQGFDSAARRFVTLSETLDRLYRAGFGDRARSLLPDAPAAAASPKGTRRNQSVNTPGEAKASASPTSLIGMSVSSISSRAIVCRTSSRRSSKVAPSFESRRRRVRGWTQRSSATWGIRGAVTNSARRIARLTCAE